ncbi:T9SS type A sorting domain-containing protein [Polaribacter haliotis]|uniref:T9SS type A sorting domain-containing protein n=1 Tax=Polaribacter haliotis TaxID=1888915 RepID=A0A7L8AJ24_9FLAO|nr:T9SS type A sorting domain-containing protein [Polaribacter haliotis]QOD62002.1 T9SS type A sorting domain-containing protein [Polaribacter haliotis]
MKKTTLIILLMFVPFFGFSQTFNFTNDAEGWTTSSADLTVNATSVTLTTNGGTNPLLTNSTANIDAEINKIAAITVKVSENGPTLMRVSFPKAPSGRVYKNVIISKNDSEFKTYYIDVSNAQWAGKVNDVKVHFKDDSSTANNGTNHTSTGETVEFDSIEFINEIPKVEKNSYTFDTDAENWEELDASVVVSAGVLTITPVAGESSKIIQSINNVNATTNKFVHIVYNNKSATNNQIRFQFKSSADNYASVTGANKSMNTSTTDFETLTFDLSEKAEWTGLAQDFQIVIRDTENGNKASAGDLQIDSVTFSSSASLGVNDEVTFANSLSIYPNPASNNLYINTDTTISKVQIFNLLGKKVIETTTLSNKSLDVSGLNGGVYLIKVFNSVNKTATQKLIIN